MTTWIEAIQAPDAVPEGDGQGAAHRSEQMLVAPASSMKPVTCSGVIQLINNKADALVALAEEWQHARAARPLSCSPSARS